MAEKKFEEALKDLEQIVDSLESGSLNLDDAIKKYEEGMKLSNFCNTRINEIQKKIEMLVKDSSGKLKTKNFSDVGKKKRPKGEELLF